MGEYIRKMQFISLDSLLEILGNPTRRLILSKLSKVPHSASDLAKSLGISRQAIHSQLNLLIDNNIIEDIDPEERRGGKFRIKSNLSVKIDITPDYYDIKYNATDAPNEKDSFEFRDLDCSVNYSKIKTPDKKIRFLGEEIRNIERDMLKIEKKRSALINQKECLILELKKIMNNQYKQKLEKILKEGGVEERNINKNLNLSEEIFLTMFFNPERYFNKIRIDELLDDMFFSNMDRDERTERFFKVKPLLQDLSQLMNFLQEDDDDWFFDF
ncbi:MAG: ArsR/SmtB family transcription factor [Candidatus Hermodarchaeota archaeon]